MATLAVRASTAPAPAPLPAWLREENDVAAAQQGVLRADDPVEVAARAAAAAEAASTAEAAAAAARAKRMPNSKLAIPSWLSEELDDTAAQEGLLIPVPVAGEKVARGPKAAKALVVRPPAPPAAAMREAPADPNAPAEETEAAGTRHAAVRAALSGPEGPSWEAELPAKAPGDAPYPLWLAPELDALKQLHPGALGPEEAAPRKPQPQPVSNRVFALQPANPGDKLVLMSHPGHAEFGAGGPRTAQHGGTVVSASAHAAASWARAGASVAAVAAFAAPVRAAAQRAAASKAQKDTWVYSWETAAAEEDAANGGVKGPPELPSGGNGGPTLASRIAAVVVSHELDARALWRN
jgi:hypothetical protein